MISHFIPSLLLWYKLNLQKCGPRFSPAVNEITRIVLPWYFVLTNAFRASKSRATSLASPESKPLDCCYCLCAQQDSEPSGRDARPSYVLNFISLHFSCVCACAASPTSPLLESAFNPHSFVSLVVAFFFSWRYAQSVEPLARNRPDDLARANAVANRFLKGDGPLLHSTVREGASNPWQTRIRIQYPCAHLSSGMPLIPLTTTPSNEVRASTPSAPLPN